MLVSHHYVKDGAVLKNPPHSLTNNLIQSLLYSFDFSYYGKQNKEFSNVEILFLFLLGTIMLDESLFVGITMSIL